MTALQELRPCHGKPVETNRWPGILFALVLHVIAIYGLTTGLSYSTIALVHEKNSQAAVIADLPANELPPPPIPGFEPPPVVTVVPDIEISLSAAPSSVATLMRPPSPAPRTRAPTGTTITPPVPITSHAVTADDYPDASVRAAEEGVVNIKYLVQADGTVGECGVVTTSGSSRLDVAACAMVKRRWRFMPATEKGKPVAVYLQAEVSFRLLPSSED